MSQLIAFCVGVWPAALTDPVSIKPAATDKIKCFIASSPYDRFPSDLPP
jgi:hypothetical protein